VAHRNREHADERRERGVEHVPLDDVAADRVGPVEHEKGDSVLSRGAHRRRHRRHVRVVARADVLHVEEENVDAFEHLLGRCERRAIDRVDRHARARVHVGRDRGPLPLVPADAVLGREERDQLDRRMLGEQIDVGPAFPIHPGVVGDEPHAATPHQVQGVGEQDLDARPYRRRGGGRRLSRRGVVGPARRREGGREAECHTEREQTPHVSG
jgi:hypothetical protein